MAEVPIIITGGLDQCIKVWDTNTKKCITTFDFEKTLLRQYNPNQQTNGEITLTWVIK